MVADAEAGGPAFVVVESERGVGVVFGEVERGEDAAVFADLPDEVDAGVEFALTTHYPNEVEVDQHVYA